MKDFKIGKLVKVIYSDGNSWMGRVSKGNVKDFETYTSLCIHRKTYELYKGIFHLHDKVIDPTPEEIKWFEACEKENKFIPLEEINTEPQYETY